MQKTENPIMSSPSFVFLVGFGEVGLVLFCFVFSKQGFSVLPRLSWNSQKSTSAFQTTSGILLLSFIVGFVCLFFWFVVVCSFQNFKESQTSQVAVTHSFNPSIQGAKAGRFLLI